MHELECYNSLCYAWSVSEVRSSFNKHSLGVQLKPSIDEGMPVITELEEHRVGPGGKEHQWWSGYWCCEGPPPYPL